ncbi:hypothetical protein ES708_33477 [subsurface metagenome]
MGAWGGVSTALKVTSGKSGVPINRDIFIREKSKKPPPGVTQEHAQAL